VTVFLPVAEATRELGVEGSSSSSSSSAKKKTLTKLVLTVSNFHFNREAAAVRQSMTCSPKDCKVSLKFSSDKFAVKNAAVGSDYHFDKSGLTVSYYAFMGLLNAVNESRIGEFWSSVTRYYKNGFFADLSIITAPNSEEIQDLEARRATATTTAAAAAAAAAAAKSTRGSGKKSGQKKAIGGARARAAPASDDEEEESGAGVADEEEEVLVQQRKRRRVEESAEPESAAWSEKDNPLSDELLASLEQDLENFASDSRADHSIGGGGGNVAAAAAAGTRSRR